MNNKKGRKHRESQYSQDVFSLGDTKGLTYLIWSFFISEQSSILSARSSRSRPSSEIVREEAAGQSDAQVLHLPRPWCEVGVGNFASMCDILVQSTAGLTFSDDSYLISL